MISGLPPEIQANLVTQPPTVGKNPAEVDEAVALHWAVGTGRVVLKAPYGTAGRDAIRVDQGELLERERAWVERTLQTQGSVVVEAWYEREMDLSFQFQVRRDGTFRALGLTPFETDERGQYHGSWVAPLGVGATREQKEFLFRGGGGSWVQGTLEHLSECLAGKIGSQGFRGRAGIDAMVVRLPGGVRKLRAPLELNPRATMGHVALAAAKPFLGGSRVVWWTLITPPIVRKAGAQSPKELLERWEQQLPRKSAGNQWVQGVFPVNDPATATQILGVVVVGPNRSTLRERMEGEAKEEH